MLDSVVIGVIAVGIMIVTKVVAEEVTTIRIKRYIDSRCNKDEIEAIIDEALTKTN